MAKKYILLLSLSIILVVFIILGVLYTNTRISVATAPEAQVLETANIDVISNGMYNVVTLFYATNRNNTGQSDLEKIYGSKRGGLIIYGKASVSIPFNHKKGEIESPKWWKLEFSSDPEKHVKTLELNELEKASFYSSIKSGLKSSKGSNALLFFHGYNVTFDDAAKKTAQMSYDLEFDGVPAFFSWPSAGNTAAYMRDEANIQWSEKHIKEFLLDFATKTTADNIYLIAHSMGNRGLTRALGELLSERPALKSKFKEVILAAPDIDAEVFKRDILPRLTNRGIPITLYASSEDVALIASKKFHGYPRAGEAGDHLVIVDGVETIDATGIDTSLLGHSYYANTRTMISDIFSITRHHFRARDRFSLHKSMNGKYWKFKP